MSPMPMKGEFPRPDPESREAFEALVGGDPEVTVRPMFGNVAAFVNGNMFTGLFGQELFVRLPEDDRARAIEEGGTPFEPMPGRPMKEYVTLPPTWRDDAERSRAWIDRSRRWVATLPPKQPRKRR